MIYSILLSIDIIYYYLFKHDPVVCKNLHYIKSIFKYTFHSICNHFPSNMCSYKVAMIVAKFPIVINSINQLNFRTTMIVCALYTMNNNIISFYFRWKLSVRTNIFAEITNLFITCNVVHKNITYMFWVTLRLGPMKGEVILKDL